MLLGKDTIITTVVFLHHYVIFLWPRGLIKQTKTLIGYDGNHHEKVHYMHHLTPLHKMISEFCLLQSVTESEDVRID